MCESEQVLQASAPDQVKVHVDPRPVPFPKLTAKDLAPPKPGRPDKRVYPKVCQVQSSTSQCTPNVWQPC